jgi:hypothetical protein
VGDYFGDDLSTDQPFKRMLLDQPINRSTDQPIKQPLCFVDG